MKRRHERYAEYKVREYNDADTNTLRRFPGASKDQLEKGREGHFYKLCYRRPLGPIEAFEPKKEWLYGGLNWAARSGRTKIVAWFLNKGLDPNGAGTTTPLNKTSIIYPSTLSPPLCQAVTSENIDTVKLLVEFGANVNISDRYGDPLIYGALHSIKMIKVLMDYGVSLNLRRKYQAPWQWDLSMINWRVFDFLMEQDIICYKPKVPQWEGKMPRYQKIHTRWMEHSTRYELRLCEVLTLKSPGPEVIGYLIEVFTEVNNCE